MLSNISSLQIFFSITFIKIIFLDNISVSNRLDLDQPRRSDLGPNCLRRQLLAANKQRVVLTENKVSSFACAYGNILNGVSLACR